MLVSLEAIAAIALQNERSRHASRGKTDTHFRSRSRQNRQLEMLKNRVALSFNKAYNDCLCFL